MHHEYIGRRFKSIFTNVAEMLILLRAMFMCRSAALVHLQGLALFRNNEIRKHSRTLL